MRRFKKYTLWLALLGALWLLTSAIRIWNYGNQDHATKGDCIIVLGAAIQGDQPSPVFEQRIKHGISLFRNGIANKILFTGGFGDGHSFSESAVGSQYAEICGIPKTAILIEEKSRTTQQNLTEAAVLMSRNSLRSAIIVSDPLHMKRALMMAEDLGIKAVSSPTPTTRYQSLSNRIGFLLRELYFYHHYRLTGH
jgi:uncharacterized SAM-binding protein YcdF (DUF218 family)